MRCWVTLLQLSSAGAWVDYVYALVSFGPASDARVRLRLDRLGPCGNPFAFEVGDAAFAFFRFIVLLAHKSLLSEADPIA